MHEPNRTRSRPPEQDVPRLSLRNAQGRELLVGSDAPESSAPADETVIATNEAGNSLTLLEEYALRRQRPSAGEFALSLICAVASLAFAALIYLKTY